MVRSWVHQLKTGEDAPLSDMLPCQGRLPGEQEELQRLQFENVRFQQ
jgi:hypothetical protein